MSTTFVVDDLEQVILTRRREGRYLDGPVAHRDLGRQSLSVAHSEHFEAAGIKATTGAVGSAHDNVLAKSVIGLDMTN